MGIKIYNTYTRKKEDFKPINGNRVNFYACGPTVYDYIHIGNARPLIMFDVFRRYLEYRGYDVNYIVNITDIDDKIINRANSENVDFRVISRRYTDAFFEDMDKLGVRPASIHPKATENIDSMIELIKRLLDNGHAYIADGDVYFDISSFPGYGKLSGRDIEQMIAGARVEIDSRKKNPLDFALWKSSKPDEPSWDSPWGPGRPGWHIECSVMSMKYAGDTLDIHAGGQDLIFPHHENETAQSEAATRKPFVNYWMHNGFLDIEGEKMSKSLGNFLTVKDILKTYNPNTIRIFFLLKHYRSPVDFSKDRMQEANQALNRLKNAYGKISMVLEKHPASGRSETENIPAEVKEIGNLKENIVESLDDDFNTAKALGYFFEIARIVNSYDESGPDASEIMVSAKKIYDEIGKEVMGLELTDEIESNRLVDDLMNFIINLRTDARKEKNWKLSDTIRDNLKAIGIILEDRPDGTIWKSEK